MVGGTLTAGLADNDQFKRVWREFGPTGQGRFEVLSGQRITSLGNGANNTYTAGQAITSQRRLEPNEVAQNVDQPLTWLVRADIRLLGETRRILAGNAQSRVTLFGAVDRGRFTGNQLLIALFADYGPTSGDRRLQVVTGEYAEHATQAQQNGAFSLDAPVTGGGFIVSMGRDDQLSPVLDSMVRAAKLRDPASVNGDLMWDDDGKYIGYRVNITAADASVKRIEVTGAASRFFPPGVFTAQQEQAARTAIRDSSLHDAPDESGNFGGGFGASALQSARHARQRRHDREQRVVDNYALTGARGNLDLPENRRNEWASLVGDFLALELPAPRARLRVVQLGGGNTGDPLFNVSLGQAAIGVFKVFANQQQAQAEIDQLRYLASPDGQPAQNQHSTVVGGYDGMQPVQVGNAQGRMGILMDAAPGRSVDSLVTSLPAPDSPLRIASVERVRAASLLVARALAEIHYRSRNAQNNGMMTPQQKYGGPQAQTDVANILQKIGFLMAPDPQRYTPQRVVELQAQNAPLTAIRNRVRDHLLPAFQQANVPATCYHGDANSGNFIIDGDRLSIIDVGFARWSHGVQGGTATGANDIAKYLNSLETLHPVAPNRLTAQELGPISDAFCATYRQSYNGLDGNNNLTQQDLAAIINIYRVEGELAALNNNTFTPAQSVARMNQWVGL
jgi:hypothetical protein